MNLTDEEKAVVEAMRLGARIDISFFQLTELDEVDKRMNLFIDIEKSGMSWIDERKHKTAGSYISFYKGMNKIKVTCFMDIKKD